MKLIDLHEMTMKVQSYEDLGKLLPNFSNYNSKYKHVGDIEQFNVYLNDDANNNTYVVFDNKSPIAFFVVLKKENELTVAFVAGGYRKKGLFAAFLFFLHRNEHFNRIVLGAQHSEDTIKAIKRIYQRFDNVYWEKDNIKKPYDPLTIDNFYGSKPTGWKIVLEDQYIFESNDWPKFFDELKLATYYFALLENE